MKKQGSDAETHEVVPFGQTCPRKQLQAIWQFSSLQRHFHDFRVTIATCNKWSTQQLPPASSGGHIQLGQQSRKCLVKGHTYKPILLFQLLLHCFLDFSIVIATCNIWSTKALPQCSKNQKLRFSRMNSYSKAPLCLSYPSTKALLFLIWLQPLAISGAILYGPTTSAMTGQRAQLHAHLVVFLTSTLFPRFQSYHSHLHQMENIAIAP